MWLHIFLTPYEAVYGFPCQMPMKYIFPMLSLESNNNMVERVIALQDKVEKLGFEMIDKHKEYVLKLRENLDRNLTKFGIGDYVYYILPVWSTNIST